jgi:hypothetical protein
MTIDERLDRLTGRHEALTQSVEILARTTRDHTQQIEALREASASLLQVAQIHEHRISGLEQGGK